MQMTSGIFAIFRNLSTMNRRAGDHVVAVRVGNRRQSTSKNKQKQAKAGNVQERRMLHRRLSRSRCRCGDIAGAGGGK
jgi:hypothetical protein